MTEKFNKTTKFRKCWCTRWMFNLQYEIQLIL